MTLYIKTTTVTFQSESIFSLFRVLKHAPPQLMGFCHRGMKPFQHVVCFSLRPTYATGNLCRSVFASLTAIKVEPDASCKNTQNGRLCSLQRPPDRLPALRRNAGNFHSKFITSLKTNVTPCSPSQIHRFYYFFS